jgi:hypothetical protein
MIQLFDCLEWILKKYHQLGNGGVILRLGLERGYGTGGEIQHYLIDAIYSGLE